MRKLIHGLLMFIFVVTMLGVVIPPLVSGGTVSLIFGIVLMFSVVVIGAFWYKRVFGSISGELY